MGSAVAGVRRLGGRERQNELQAPLFEIGGGGGGESGQPLPGILDLRVKRVVQRHQLRGAPQQRVVDGPGGIAVVHAANQLEELRAIRGFQEAVERIGDHPLVGRGVSDRPPWRQRHLIGEARRRFHEEGVQRADVQPVQLRNGALQQSQPILARCETGGRTGQGGVLSELSRGALVESGGREALQHPIENLTRRLTREGRGEDRLRCGTGGQQADDARGDAEGLPRPRRCEHELTGEAVFGRRERFVHHRPSSSFASAALSR